MEQREYENRLEALNNAVRHKLRDQTASQIIATAETYFKFLQGDKEEK